MLQLSLPGPAWAHLRTWADTRRPSTSSQTLRSILDSAESLRVRYPILGGQLWKSALDLAARLGYQGTP